MPSSLYKQAVYQHNAGKKHGADRSPALIVKKIAGRALSKPVDLPRACCQLGRDLVIMAQAGTACLPVTRCLPVVSVRIGFSSPFIIHSNRKHS
ncbi:hypothetical protein [Herbaspirillum autotrophicum]|uniref:hypothetical protein n=1 Tax=Herbaspirillum autotrophicum TaxID=180195 RepID=UPI0012EE6ECF|nr:hypothetical protein [Herbaspirillum autotrophicum]